jgi:cytochrome c553
MLMRNVGAAMFGVALCLGSAGVRADATDLHAYWDARCKDCHGDAGPFARRTLRVDGGRLLGWHHVDDLDRFLAHHYLTPALVPRVKAMLAAQAATAPLFAPRCGGCHGSAADFARKSLAREHGVLVGAASRRPVAEMLRTHGGARADEIDPLVKTLERVLAEVGQEPDPSR